MFNIFRSQKEKEENSEIRTRKIYQDEDFKLEKSIKKLEKREVVDVEHNTLPQKYEDNLNQEQKFALLSKEGQFLVIAGAGSGKTRMITYRTAWLIENGVLENRILMITFTRKACEEMSLRLKLLLEKDRIKTTVVTFHSFCARLIKKHNNIFKLGDFSIIEEEKKTDIIRRFIKILGLDKKYMKKFYNAEMVSSGFSKMVERGLDFSSVFTEKEKLEDVKVVYDEFKKYKSAKNLYEYDDLVRIVVNKFKENRVFLEAIRERIEYVVVDEYQDSNHSQRELIKLLILPDKNLMVVGDDSQSIYGFRGADFTNILKFGEDFPQGKLIKFKKNYRSSDEIISYINRITTHFRFRYNKTTFGTEKIGGKIEIRHFINEDMEDEYIVSKIIELQNDFPLEEIAILYRNRYTVKKLEEKLSKCEIPFYKKGDEKRKGVAIISIHLAKGLEWEAVFIPRLLDGILPSSFEKEDLEEEKRVFYVGCSRAKQLLFLTYPRFFYEKVGYFEKPSRFLSY